MYFKHMFYEFVFLSKVNYDNGKFVQAPTYTYNEVMLVLLVLLNTSSDASILFMKCFKMSVDNINYY